MTESMNHMEQLQEHIDNCEVEMMKRAAPMFEHFMHITQIPGIGTLSAILIVSEIGVDMKQFESDKQLAAIKDKEGYFGIKYTHIKRRRGHKKVIIAIARMMLVSIYHMVLTSETFNPSDYESFKNPKPINQIKLTEESAIEFLKKSGFDVFKLTKLE